MASLILASLLAGLLGSPHCVAMCGAFATSCNRVPAGLPAWHTGRILTYSGLGALAGQFGAFLPGPPWLPAALATLFLIWFTGALAGLLPEPRLVPRSLSHAGARAAASSSLGAQFAFGVINGFLPCGLVYSALGIPVALADPAAGALAMLAFGAGTLPALSFAAIGLRRLTTGSLRTRRLMAALVLAAGLAGVWTRSAHNPAAGGHHHVSVPEPAPAQ